MRFGRVGLCVLGIGLMGAGCGSKDAGTPSASAATTSAPSNKTTEKPAESAKPTAKKEEKVDIDGILKRSDTGPKSGALKVDLSKIDDKDAPTLGGGQDTKETPPEEKTPEPPPGKELEWLKSGPVEIPNPGWTKQALDDGGVLSSPDNKVHFLFTEFSDDADGQAKLEALKKALPLDNLEWSQPQIVKLGPDALPSAIGGGTGVDKGGKKIELVYAMIETGTEGHNLLVLGGAEEGIAKEVEDDAQQIILNIRKAH
ncbi:MAG: hypothetical protein U0414_31265 [Polyangiaceae bacterium]